MRTKKHRTLAALIGAGLLTGAALALAHANFKPKEAAFGGRQYTEGSTAYLSLVAAHGCRDENGEAYATRHVYTVFPNAVDLGASAITTDDEGQVYGGNATMGIRPKQDANWHKISQKAGPVGEYYSRGAKTEDVRSIRWLGGHVPYDRYAELEFRATLPQLSGCTERLRVYVPTVQYCEDGHFNAWVREPTAQFSEEVISAGYAPYFDVVRDLTSNPLPELCEAGESLEAYPSTTDIDEYLTRRKQRRSWHK